MREGIAFAVTAVFAFALAYLWPVEPAPIAPGECPVAEGLWREVELGKKAPPR